MSDLIKIAVDAMGGDGSPKKIIDGIIHNNKSSKENKPYFKTANAFHYELNLILGFRKAYPMSDIN